MVRGNHESNRPNLAPPEKKVQCVCAIEILISTEAAAAATTKNYFILYVISIELPFLLPCVTRVYSLFYRFSFAKIHRLSVQTFQSGFFLFHHFSLFIKENIVYCQIRKNFSSQLTYKKGFLNLFYVFVVVVVVVAILVHFV